MREGRLTLECGTRSSWYECRCPWGKTSQTVASQPAMCSCGGGRITLECGTRSSWYECRCPWGKTSQTVAYQPVVCSCGGGRLTLECGSRSSWYECRCPWGKTSQTVAYQPVVCSCEGRKVNIRMWYSFILYTSVGVLEARRLKRWLPNQQCVAVREGRLTLECGSRSSWYECRCPWGKTSQTVAYQPVVCSCEGRKVNIRMWYSFILIRV